MEKRCASDLEQAATMIMDGLETLQPSHHHHHSATYLLTESAAAAAAAAHHHINVLSFDTCLQYRGTGVNTSPVPATVCDEHSGVDEVMNQEPQQGDLNTPVTTSSDVPTFFGPSTVVEPPPITG